MDLFFNIEGLLINRFGNVEEQSDEVITAALKMRGGGTQKRKKAEVANDVRY